MLEGRETKENECISQVKEILCVISYLDLTFRDRLTWDRAFSEVRNQKKLKDPL